MSVDQKTIGLIIRGVISQLDEERQERIKACEASIRALLEVYGEDGHIALSLVGAEEAEKYNN